MSNKGLVGLANWFAVFNFSVFKLSVIIVEVGHAYMRHYQCYTGKHHDNEIFKGLNLQKNLCK